MSTFNADHIAASVAKLVVATDNNVKDTKRNTPAGFLIVGLLTGAKALEGSASALGMQVLTEASAINQAFLIPGTEDDKPFTFKLNSYYSSTKEAKTRSVPVIMETLFGVTPDHPGYQSVRALFNRTLPAAILAAQMGTEVKATESGLSGFMLSEIVPLSEVVDGKEVPNNRHKAAAKALKAASATLGKNLTDQEALDAAAQALVNADGREHPLFGKIPTPGKVISNLREQAEANGIVPKKEQRASRTPEADPGNKMSEALAFLIPVVTEYVMSDETDTPLSEANESMLEELSGLLLKFFTKG
jgi:hypothetical protein